MKLCSTQYCHHSQCLSESTSVVVHMMSIQTNVCTHERVHACTSPLTHERPCAPTHAPSTPTSLRYPHSQNPQKHPTHVRILLHASQHHQNHCDFSMLPMIACPHSRPRCRFAVAALQPVKTFRVLLYRFDFVESKRPTGYWHHTRAHSHLRGLPPFVVWRAARVGSTRM